MRRLGYSLFQAALAFLLLTASAWTAAESRTVAIADIHGDLDSFISILQKTGLIDKSLHWSGGNATLVQTGDSIDRGPKSRRVMDLLMALEKESSRSGGSVRVSLGNHEVLNIMGDLRYVVPEDYAAFSDSRSEQRRQTAFQSYSKVLVERGQSVDKEAWMRVHPPGFIEHREAFGPRGTYGRWLRRLPAVIQVGDSVFLHGGLSPELATRSIAQINDAVQSEIQAFDRNMQYLVDMKLAFPFSTFEELVAAAKADMDERRSKTPAEQTDEDRNNIRLLEDFLKLGGWLSVHPDGPLWFRGYDGWSEAEGESRAASLVNALNVKRIIVGHTPQPNGEIRSRFGGKVFLIDTGMLTGYIPGGKASALEIAQGRVRAIYNDKQIDLN